MTVLTSGMQRRALALLISFHIIIIIASNYLVQLPITLFGYHTTWGAFSFPFIFLATDLTVRLLGKQAARRVIARVMLPALVASYVVSVVFQEGSYRGIDALLSFNDFVLRISLASFVAYVIGQLLDIQVFDRLRRIKAWWIAPSLSTVLGNLADNAGKWAHSRVRVSLRENAQQRVLVVEDDGPGVPAQEREQLGTRGWRLDQQMPGHGLGLAIVRDLAARYQGTIQFEASELGGLSARLQLQIRQG